MSDDESAVESEEDLEDLFRKRRCTDIPCCLLFVLALIALVAMLVYGAMYGNARKLNHGFDGRGRQCGVDPDVIERPLLFFCPVVTSSGEHSVNLDDPVCVSQCPSPGAYVAAANAGCALPEAYPTSQVGSRYCLPSGSTEAVARRKVEKGMRDTATEVFTVLDRIGKAWPVLLLAVLLACAMGYIFLFMLKTVAGCIIWFCALVGLAAFLLLGAFLWAQSEDAMEMATTYKVLAVISWVASVLVALLICCCRQEVKLSTKCMGQAAVVIWRMPILLLSPLLKAIIKTVLFLLLAVGFIHLLATGEVSGVGREHHVDFSGPQKALLVLYAFISLWVLAYVSALYQFSIAFATAKYFCANIENGRKTVAACSVCEGVRVGLWYHSGSLAFGSALIALLELLQRLLEFVEKKSMEGGEMNKVITCCISTVLCCCRCLEGIIQFVNKNVYIDIALTSKNFCAALQSIAKIMIDHGAAMAILNGATCIFQVVGMAAITASCGLLSAWLLSSEKYESVTSTSYIPNPGYAVALSAILAFLVAWSFMAIFDVTSDTLLICFAEDMTQSGGARHGKHNQDLKAIYEEAEERAREMQGDPASSDDGHPHPPYRYARGK
ncbi:slc44a5a [Symbiodinium sp. CCMP2456]|nr:slc44a5a [Symbiodinium sp. CCMP2456]